MHKIAPIRDEASYQQALADIRRLWGSTPGTREGDRLDVLMVLLDAYESAQAAAVWTGIPAQEELFA